MAPFRRIIYLCEVSRLKLETACPASYIDTVKQNFIDVGHINYLLACGQTPYRWVGTPISGWEHSADLTIYLAPINGALTPKFVKSPLYQKEGGGA